MQPLSGQLSPFAQPGVKFQGKSAPKPRFGADPSDASEIPKASSAKRNGFKSIGYNTRNAFSNLGSFRKYLKDPESRQILLGLLGKYGAPTAVSVSLMSPLGWIALPITGTAAWLTSRWGDNTIKNLEKAGALAADGPLHRITSIQSTLQQELGGTVKKDLAAELNITAAQLKKPEYAEKLSQAFITRQTGKVVEEHNRLIQELFTQNRPDGVGVEESQHLIQRLQITDNSRVHRGVRFVLDAKHTTTQTKLGRWGNRIAQTGRKLPRFLKIVRLPFMVAGFAMQAVSVLTRNAAAKGLAGKLAKRVV